MPGEDTTPAVVKAALDTIADLQSVPHLIALSHAIHARLAELAEDRKTG